MAEGKRVRGNDVWGVWGVAALSLKSVIEDQRLLTILISECNSYLIHDVGSKLNSAVNSDVYSDVNASLVRG